ncbi:sensor histidine kinase [Glaciecola sp. SC05]|uniref:sensor histidine kinase n=1 Tax=Glaciecola sp. SC05 TaxID=1987355 RepID=UPI003529351A
MRIPTLCFYQRLAVSLVAGFFLVIALLAAASSYLQTAIQREGEQRLHLELAAHLANDNPLLKTGVYDYDALKGLFHTLMILGPSFEFYFLGPQGDILSYSAEPGTLIKKQIDLSPIKNLIDDSSQLPLYGEDPKSEKNTKIFSAAPVFDGEKLQGYLYIIIGGEEYDSIIEGIQRSKGVQQFAMIILAGLVFLLFALLLLFRLLTAPLKRLSDDMDIFRASGFNLAASGVILQPWKNDSRNEVQRLGFSFNEMLKHIDKQWQLIKQTDGQRRSLLTDLSHDLRTPLANLQGFIETLAIRGQDLSAQEQKRFIDISLKNLHNLKRLIDQIFELAYLESGHVKMKLESFLLNELLHDIAAKFAIKSKDKNIQIHVKVRAAQTYVTADIEKLERILTNLIENAIRHTPEGGRIEMLITDAGNRVGLSVIDSGVGIAKEELQRIFDARYQASNTERDSNTHVGLGLAISQKLVELFDGQLEVTSDLGMGTTFYFTLAKVDHANPDH